MKRIFIYIVISIISFLSFSNIKASPYYTLSDSAKISLLTSTAWNEEIYAMFGHTAIRINDPVQKLDYAFNYGLFDFAAPNFLGRFVTGQTDYMVGAIETKMYMIEYHFRGVGVIEQTLNLNKEEKQAVYDALCLNISLENRVYRYNFFYDNCATRPRDIIEKNILGTINYTKTDKDQTYRDLLHECTSPVPWARFGIDLVIGADADKKINDRQKDFLPIYLKNAYDGAIINTTDSIGTKSLVLKEENILVESESNKIDQSPANSPLIYGCIVLAIALLISYLSYKKKCLALAKTFDTLLFLVAGLAGSIILFLMFFSEHPCTNPNWNIVWLNPLQLIVAFLFFVKPLSKYIYYYHFINFAALSLFVLAWVLIPQHLEIAFLPFILSLGVRSGMQLLINKAKK